jgi:hypothetical protein
MEFLEDESTNGGNLDFPSFEFTPLEYLEFAQDELGDKDSESIGVPNSLNCVNHLKRAADCAIDTFFHILHLYDLFKKRNLKFEKKTELLNAMGLFNPRSLNKLNTMRNKMEHEYNSPDSVNLELYFELVQGFVYALDGYMYMLALNAEMFFISAEKESFQGGMSVRYDFEKPSIIFELEEGENKDLLEFNASDIENFAFAANAFFLLCRFKFLINAGFVAHNLELAYALLQQKDVIKR